MAGIPLPVEGLPDRTIVVRVIRGEISNNIPNQPVELHGAGPVRSVKTDDTGRAQFSDLPLGATVKAVTIVGGERAESREFPVPARGGIRLILLVSAGSTSSGEAGGGAAASAPPASAPAVAGTVVLGGQTRFVVEFDDDIVQVFYLLEILNNAQSPVNPPGPLVIDLPKGAQGATALQGSTPQAVVKDARVTIAGPFQPGRTVAELAYQLPGSGADRTIVQTFPIALEELAVIVDKMGDVGVQSPQLTATREASNAGRAFIMATGPGLPARSELRIELTGVPHRSRVPLATALGLAIAILGAGVWAALHTADSARAARRRQLEARREKLMGDLVRLEEQRSAGKVDDARYVSKRAELMLQLGRVYGELDTTGPRTTDEGVAA